MALPLIIDISADYPDAVNPGKTPAIARLVAGSAGQFDHRVFSFNRRGALPGAMLGAGSLEAVGDDGQVASWIFRAPPYGLALRRSMDRIGEAIAGEISKAGRFPALVHGHKLSFEGIAAYRVAQSLGLPFALTLQGNTDRKVIGIRPDLRPLYRRIWREAGVVFAMSPWIADYCAQTLGERARPPVILPCITNATSILAPRNAVPQRLLTAFRLDHHRNKNLRRLVKAVAALRPQYGGLELEIAGGGSALAEHEVDAIIDAEKASGFVRRIGLVKPDAIQAWMNGAAAFAMPSHRESFGMVHVEALLSGCPILYSRGTAVDGYFPDAAFAIGCDPASDVDIASGIARLLADRTTIAGELAQWQGDHGARFLGPAILATYCRELQGLADCSRG